MPYLSSESGRRGNWRWVYGTHAWVPEIDNDWSKGFIRDIDRTRIPPGSAYDIVDFVVNIPGALYRRGGTVGIGDMSTGDYGNAVAYAEFPSGSKLVGVDNNGHIWSITVPGGTSTDLGGSTVTTIDTPKLRIGGSKNLLIFPVSDGTTSPVKYDGSTAPGSLGGSPPAGKYAAVYKSRLALGGSSSTPQRAYFSPTPDIESTWDTTNSWVDFDHPITGMAALQNALIVFSKGHTERLLGTTPPPNSDMDRQPLFDVGCTDARSIAVANDFVYFASPSGVYRTNGSSLENLAEMGGISSYWKSLFGTSYDPTTWKLTLGVHAGEHLMVFLVDNTGVLQIGLMCYLPNHAWTRVTNLTPSMFAFASDIPELFFADRGGTTIARCSGIVAPNIALSGADHNSVAIQPSMITRCYGDSAFDRAFGDTEITLGFMDQSSPTNPVLAVNVGYGPRPSFAAVGQSPLSPVTYSSSPVDVTTNRMTTSKDGRWMSIQLSQINASAETTIRQIAAYSRPYSLARSPGSE